MLGVKLKKILFILCVCFGTLVLGADSYAKNDDIFSNSGLPLPRFVSLAENKTNVRAGPGQKYPIKWVLNRKGLPVEVILEFDHWRKIKDHEGQVGWVFHTLLSGKRTALIKGADPAYSYEKPQLPNGKKSRISMYLEPFVQVEVEGCRGGWCNVSASGYSGWIKIKSLWGVYESENID